MPDVYYAVAERNQASGLIECLASGSLHWTREDAEDEASAARADTAALGRREEYIVCEVIPVEDGDG